MRWILPPVLILLFAAAAGSTCGAAYRDTEKSVADVADEAIKALVSVQSYHESRPLARGSGFVIDSDGLIVTNYHVVADADRITAALAGHTAQEAELAAISKAWDIAVLQVAQRDLPALPLASGADTARLGETVVALGNPHGLTGTVSTGIVSARRDGDELHFRQFHVPIIQTTAAISPGSSGGPLLNLKGEAVGINAFMLAEGQNLNFAVPIDKLHRVLSAQQERHEPVRGQITAYLEWEGRFDLDLEVWSTEGNYLGDAHWIGRSPDILDGSHGQEWLAFKDYGHYDLSRGRYILSPFFAGPETDEPVEARLRIVQSDGQEIRLQQDLYYHPPGDQWYAVEICADTGEVAILDSLQLPSPARYTHRPGEVAVELKWAGPADLDLEIWSEDYIYLDKAAAIGESPDSVHGDEGSEWLVFRDYLVGDYSTGRFIVSPYYFGPEDHGPVRASLTIYFPDGTQEVITQELQYTPPYDQWFAILVDTDAASTEIIDAFWE